MTERAHHPWGRFIDCHVHLPPDEPALMARFEALTGRLHALGMQRLVVSDVLQGVRNRMTPTRDQALRAWERARDWAATDARRAVLPYICSTAFTAAQATRDCRRFVAEGAAGLKVWVAAQRHGRILASTFRVAEMAAELDVPVMFHSFLRGTATDIGELTPAHVVEIARHVPQARIVAAHVGGDYQRGVAYYRGVGNVWVDISGGYSYEGMLDTVVEWLGVNRVLYGSDYPGRGPWSQLAKLEHSRLTDRQLRQVCYTNAMALFFGKRS